MRQRTPEQQARLDQCAVCGHVRHEHGTERDLLSGNHYVDGKREFCMECPGYEEPGYPNGKAWHRFKGELLMTDNPQDPPARASVPNPVGSEQGGWDKGGWSKDGQKRRLYLPVEEVTLEEK